MKCPVCKETDLCMADRQGVEIDYCPQCRGVWLDRGELDKIIERSMAAPQQAPAQLGQPQHFPPPPPNAYPGNSHRGHDDHDSHGYYDSHGRYKRKKSWLGELFD